MSSAIVQSAQAQSISLLPINGQTFSPGGKLVWEIPPDLGLIKASRGETYLVFTVRNNSSTPLRWMLATSGQALIKDVTVFSMATGQQLESLQNYNQAMWILDQFTQVEHGIQQSVEGMVSEPWSLEFVGGSVERKVVPSYDSADGVYNSVFSPIDKTGKPATTTEVVFPAWQVCVPLKLGIFGAFGEEKLCPVISLGGLRIEMTLSDAQPACVPLCPVISDVPLRAPITTPLFPTAGIVVEQGVNLNTVNVLNTTIAKSGLVVGQVVAFASQGGTSNVASSAIVSMTEIGTSVGVSFNDTVDCGVGVSGRIATTAAQWASALNYSVEAVELRVQQMVPPPGVLDKLTGSKVDYSFRTFELFYDSIPAAERRHQVEIHSVASRAKSIMSFLYDSTEELDENSPSYFYGTDPDTLNLNSVQFFINNRLYPLQSYDPRRTRDRPQTLNELQKAFEAIDMPVKSFGDASGANLDSYSNSFLISRALVRSGDFVYNLREAEPSIRLGFSGTRTNITRVNTFVWSDRVISVGPDGMTLLL